MLQTYNVIGNEETTFYTFGIRAEGMNIIVSPGIYYNQGEILYQTESETVLTVPGAGSFRIWLYPTGFELSQGLAHREDAINMIAWIDVPEGATSLEEAAINFIRMVV
ncbi:hypothetical protein AB3N02_13800 [Priestia aryabhattai]|uniref:hypothetical protein n=1 Tax=Priestia aryabhattai TaxID=412384 RepID=UPI0039A33D09